MSIDKLYACIERKKINQSQAREAIYRVLMNTEDECISVTRILDELSSVYHKQISVNTIYRHLNLFVSCKLAMMIQDDFKKAYFCLTKEVPSTFLICTKCHSIGQLTLDPCILTNELESSEFITIHKKCQSCKVNKKVN